MVELVGQTTAEELRRRSVEIYLRGAAHARQQGIIIADTKFEFGIVDGRIIFVDERLTPDSSRFWDASLYKSGGSQTSYDKQPIRDWLEMSGWNKEPPAPRLPEEVVSATTERYLAIHELLTGRSVVAN